MNEKRVARHLVNANRWVARLHKKLEKPDNTVGEINNLNKQLAKAEDERDRLEAKLRSIRGE